MARDNNTSYHWTALFGKPERIKQVHYIDDHGLWDSSFYRADGSHMSFKPNPLELSRTKDELLRKQRYFKNVNKAVMKVKY